ncbi:MAG: EamA family transporter [Planctomycetaceae bacterium]|nr:EamA family transporter [Planctomycetaceae bacterium]
MSHKGQLPEQAVEKIAFLVKALLGDPIILSGFVSAFVASLFWMAAMTKFELSFAYPFMSLSFVLVFILSVFLFHDTVNFGKACGLGLIVLGIIITAKYGGN